MRQPIPEQDSITEVTILTIGKWTEVLGEGRLSGGTLDPLTHNVHILEVSGEGCRQKRNPERAASQALEKPVDVRLTLALALVASRTVATPAAC